MPFFFFSKSLSNKQELLFIWQFNNSSTFPHSPGLKVNDQLVAYATRFSAVRLKNYLWSHHHALKAKVQCDFSSAYSPDHTNVLRLINTNLNIDIIQSGTK